MNEQNVTSPGAHRRRRATVAAAAAVAVVVAGVGGAVGVSALSSGRAAAVSTAAAAGRGGGFGSRIGAGNAATATTTRAATASEEAGVVDITTVLDYGTGEAAGTGIVLTSSGEVLTNNHVVDGATTITVTVVGTGRSFTASVVGTDPTDDVAVIQLAGASGLTTATLASPAQVAGVAVGDAVTAVGNAGGTGGTPTAAPGSVIALDQSITATDDSGADAEQLAGLIEVDAAVQAGDSGGPLYDGGVVVGIDTAAGSATTTGASNTGTGGADGTGAGGTAVDGAGGGTGAGGTGTAVDGAGGGTGAGGTGTAVDGAGGGTTTTTAGFAIPISTATAIADRIESGEQSATIHQGYPAFLGVQLADGSGATVSGVLSGSPAASAGLEAGDTITAVGWTPVPDAAALAAALGTHHAQDRVRITWTDTTGGTHTATVTLSAGPAD